MLLTKIWKNQPGKYFCISTRDRLKKWEDNFFKRSEFSEIKEFIENNLDKDVYWCPHGFIKPRRLSEYAAIPHLLWADLDEVDPRELGDLMPSVAWESSPGRYAALWHIDDLMTKDLNRRLSYHIGADKGGWDITQVLRVPGTNNYKYTSAPKVRLLWSDGDEFTCDEIEKLIPKEKKRESVGTENAALKIYRRYEKKLSAFARKELIKGKPTPGKRSEVIWKLAHELIEAGMTRDEAFELLRISPWNKFKDRRDGDTQLKRELDKALEQHLTVSVNGSQTFEEEEDEESEEDQPHIFLSQSMAEVEEEDIDWIWYPYIARGELTILEGDPGLGKSYLAQIVCKHIVDGEKLPSVQYRKPVKGKVAYFDIENSMGSVTKKRLSANGCKNYADYYQDAEPFSIDDDETLNHVHRAIERLKPEIVVFDTLNTYIGKADIHKSSETQQAFKRFVEIARRHKCSVMVLRHLTKSTKTSALYRGQGSIAFTGLARVVMTVGIHPDDPDVRVMAVTKINVTRAPKGLTFTIKGMKDSLDNHDRSVFEWGEFVDITSDDLVSAGPAKTDKDRTEEVKQFLEEILDSGPMEVNKIIRAAEARSIGRKLLYKVADEMNLTKQISGFAKSRQSTWGIPESKNIKKFNDGA